MRPKTITSIRGKNLWTPVKVPSQKTLEVYGLTYSQWKKLLERCKGVCEICGTIPASGRLVIDHEHVLGWKRKLPAQRALYVRGILCSTCNHYILSRFSTSQKLRAGADYLDAYTKRRPK